MYSYVATMLMEGGHEWIVQCLSDIGAAVMITLVREDIRHDLDFGRVDIAPGKAIGSN